MLAPWRVSVAEAGSSPARSLPVREPLLPTSPALFLLHPQVLDGLLAQYGTVENVEQGKMVQHGGSCLCNSPSAAPQLHPRQRKTRLFFPVIGTGLKWFSPWTQALLAEVGPPVQWWDGMGHQSSIPRASRGHWQIKKKINCPCKRK